MQVFANSEDSAIAIDMALKRTVNTGFGKSMLEQMTRGDSHVQGKGLAMGRHVQGL
jgi:hypothetical protein